MEKTMRGESVFLVRRWVELAIVGAVVSSTLALVGSLWHIVGLCTLLDVLMGGLSAGNLLLLFFAREVASKPSGKVPHKGSPCRKACDWLGLAFGLGCFIATLFLLAMVLRLQNASQHINTDIRGFPSGVKVKVDSSGIVHIASEKESDVDIYFVQGLVMAQMRTFQMEFQRRISSGTLAALVGSAGLKEDRLFRTLNFQRHSEMNYAKLKATKKFQVEIDALERFAAGVNAYFLDARRFQPPLEIILLCLLNGVDIPKTLAPWKPSESLAWSSVMAYGLAGNLERELLRFQMVVQRGMSFERLEEVLPAYDTDVFPTVLDAHDVCSQSEIEASKLRQPNAACKNSKEVENSLVALRCGFKPSPRNRQVELKEGYGSPRIHSGLRPGGNLFGTLGASNNWVLSGERSETGKPLLANDPHLELTSPSFWMLFHLKTGEHERFGAAMCGLPGIVLGRNMHIAWGVTDTGADVQDLYVLNTTTDSEGRPSYVHRGQVVPLHVRKEVLSVAGGADEVVHVQEAPHYGPILTDTVVQIILDDEDASLGGHSLALRWMALSDDTVLDTTYIAFYQISMATNWNEFRRALGYLVMPGQNFVFASTQDIGYQMTGLLPRRQAGHTGLVPVPGDGRFDWGSAPLPFEKMPSVLNPAKGFVVSANNQVQPPCYSVTPTCDWDGLDGYRARQITALVESKELHSVESMVEIQQDVKSPFANDMQIDVLSKLCDLAAVKSSPDASVACEALARSSWDGEMPSGSINAAVFNSWIVRLFQTAGPETGKEFWEQLYFTWKTFRQAVNHVTFADKGTGAANAMRCSANKSHAQCVDYAVDALADVGRKWRSGEVHPWGKLDTNYCKFVSQVFNGTLVDCLMSRRIAHSGDRSSVNVGSFDASTMIQTHGPSFRLIASMDDGFNPNEPWKSRYVNGIGQNGCPLSFQYDSMATKYVNGDYFQMQPEPRPPLTASFPVE